MLPEFVKNLIIPGISLDPGAPSAPSIEKRISVAGFNRSVPSAPTEIMCPVTSPFATAVVAPVAVPLVLPKIRYGPPESFE